MRRGAPPSTWIATLKCDEDSCFFVYDENGTVLAHPDRTVIGKNQSDLKDIKGVSLFRSMLAAAKTKGDGVTSFHLALRRPFPAIEKAWLLHLLPAA